MKKYKEPIDKKFEDVTSAILTKLRCTNEGKDFDSSDDMDMNGE